MLQVTALFTLLAIACLAIAIIDIKTRTIPDALNFVVCLLGLVYAAQRGVGEIPGALLSGLFAAAAAWLVRHGYRHWRGFDGLGMGDVKLFGAAGIWVELPNVPIVILIAAGAALAFIAALRLMGQNVSAQTSLPFGPFIVVGLLASLAVTVGA